MFRKSLIATALAGVLATTPALATTGAASETWTEASIVTAYTLNEHLNPFDIDVEVRSSTVTLSGEVESEVEKGLAEEIARSVDGVKRVENHLRVSRDATRKDAGGNGFARSVEDASITARVKSQLLWNRATSGTAVNVTTESGVVTLEGRVDSDAERALVRKVVRNTEGVRSVNDRMEVKGATSASSDGQVSPSEAVSDLTSNVSDTWVTTKVKSALLYSSDVEGTDINVDTDAGIVTLSGTVDNEQEMARAIEIVEGIIGVKGVQTELRLSPSTS